MRLVKRCADRSPILDLDNDNAPPVGTVHILPRLRHQAEEVHAGVLRASPPRGQDRQAPSLVMNYPPLGHLSVSVREEHPWPPPASPGIRAGWWLANSYPAMDSQLGSGFSAAHWHHDRSNRCFSVTENAEKPTLLELPQERRRSAHVNSVLPSVCVAFQFPVEARETYVRGGIPMWYNLRASPVQKAYYSHHVRVNNFFVIET
jgi:hypothetical protein